MKKILVLLFALAIGAVAGTTGSSEFTQFNTAGTQASDVIISGITAWTWIFAFIPFGFAIFIAFKFNEYLNQKDEQSGGQSEPKVSRYGKVILVGAAAIVIAYILLGLFGKVFAGMEFSDTWRIFVTDFWGKILTAGGTGAGTNP